MKVALVSPYDLARPGGVRSHIVGLGEALAQRGHLVEIIAPSAKASGTMATTTTTANTRAAKLGNLPVVTCGRARGMRFSGTQIDMTWASWRQVGDACRRGYDVMHFHTIWNPLVPFQLASRFRGPKVATFHDVPGPDTPRWAARLMGPASRTIRRLSLDKLIAVSGPVSQYLAKSAHELIPNGIAVPQDVATTTELARDRDGIACVGRLEPRKDVKTLIDGIARYGNPATPVWIMGDGPLRAELEKQARTLGLTQVQFLGEVSDDVKWATLQRAAVLVAPSRGGESFGIVILEALAAGAVPLAADNVGYREVLADRADALLFPAGDADALGYKLRRLMLNAAARRELQQWGDAHWRPFAWDTLAARVERVYDAAVDAQLRGFMRG